MSNVATTGINVGPLRGDASHSRASSDARSGRDVRDRRGVPGRPRDALDPVRGAADAGGSHRARARRVVGRDDER